MYVLAIPGPRYSNGKNTCLRVIILVRGLRRKRPWHKSFLHVDENMFTRCCCFLVANVTNGNGIKSRKARPGLPPVCLSTGAVRRSDTPISVVFGPETATPPLQTCRGEFVSSTYIFRKLIPINFMAGLFFFSFFLRSLTRS